MDSTVAIDLRQVRRVFVLLDLVPLKFIKAIGGTTLQNQHYTKNQNDASISEFGLHKPISPSSSIT